MQRGFHERRRALPCPIPCTHPRAPCRVPNAAHPPPCTPRPPCPPASSWQVKRARAKQLSPDEYTTGTFVISNLGMFGVESFDAILPPGEAAGGAPLATLPTPHPSSLPPNSRCRAACLLAPQKCVTAGGLPCSILQ